MRALVPVVVVLVAVATVPGVATAASGGAAVASSGVDTTERLGDERVAAGASDAAASETTTPQRPDPENDTIGWEAGYWYDDPLPSVDASDGFNQTELDKVVARAMARVERVRQLEFERTVPVELIGRDTYRERYASGPDENTSEAFRQFDNAKFEALFLINESTDSLETQSTNRGASVGGFYSPSQDRIVVVSENTSQPKLNEVTLSQELFHALQDQQFDLSALNYSTREKHNAADGIVEGDGNLVDRLYQRRCEAEWDCFEDTSNESSSSGGGLANIGVYFVKYQPYSDGPTFVTQLKREGGWAAVDAAYENPPTSSSVVISPDEYGDEEPKTVRLADRTGDDWQRVRPPGRVDYAEVGQAGIASMFVYPAYNAETRSEGQAAVDILGGEPNEVWLNYTASGELSDTDPLNYGFAAAEGWAGDRMHVYRDADNETAYVWRIAWESPEEAAEFRDAYATLVEFWGGEAVGESTYRISEGGFADAIHVAVSGDTVTITNAPTVSELSAVRSSVSVPTTDGDGESTATPADDGDGADGQNDESTATSDGGDDAAGSDDPATTAPVPGFGASVAVLALAAALVGLLARRRR